MKLKEGLLSQSIDSAMLLLQLSETSVSMNNWKDNYRPKYKINCKYKEFQESKDTRKSTSINKEVDEEVPQGKNRDTNSTPNQLDDK